jgi:hypothetical protein
MGFNTWASTGAEIFRFSQFSVTNDIVASADSLIENPQYLYRGIDIREHVISASLRFLCRGTFDWSDPISKPVIERYIKAAKKAVDVAMSFFEEFDPHVVICFHGIYVPHGVFGSVARSKGIRVVNWNTSYRKRRILISNGDTYHKAMCYEQESKWNVPLDGLQKTTIMNYLGSREDGSQDWQQFNDNPDKNIERDLKLKTFVDLHSKTFLLLPNVIWDAQLQYDASIYETMSGWVIDTIRIFKQIPESGLIIRIHPAEVRRYSPTREPLSAVISSAFPEGLPENVHVIEAHEEHSTYRLSELCQAAIIYGTKTGLELAARGIPVIVCGEAWIKDKGMSFDPHNVDEYIGLLRSPPLVMTNEMKERAVRFAYHFFERVALELSFLRSTAGDLNLEIDDTYVNSIADGSNPVLERICEEIESDSGYFIGGIVK